MKLKEQLLQDIQDFVNPFLLTQIFDFVELLKNNTQEKKSYNPISEFAGTLTDKEAQNMQKMMNEEFNTVEGEW